jgi:hypothetical protein
MPEQNKAVFLSYAYGDAEAAGRMCASLRAAGIEVWFDQSELRGGTPGDAAIRKQIKTCALFIPIISTIGSLRGSVSCSGHICQMEIRLPRSSTGYRACCASRMGTYAYRGERDEAFAWLERAYRQKDSGLWLIKGDPLLKNLAGDPRYPAFLRKMKLPA